MYYWHDGAPPHFIQVVMQYLNHIFPSRWIGCGGAQNWPPRSPVLNPLYYHVWGYMKAMVYAHKVNTREELLLIKRYNLYKVLVCSATFFQLFPSCTTFFQLRTFMLFISSKTSSYQRVLGLPISLLDMGFHLLILCIILSPAMHSKWPKQFNFCFLINPITFCPFNIPFISWLVLILQ